MRVCAEDSHWIHRKSSRHRSNLLVRRLVWSSSKQMTLYAKDQQTKTLLGLAFPNQWEWACGPMSRELGVEPPILRWAFRSKFSYILAPSSGILDSLWASCRTFQTFWQLSECYILSFAEMKWRMHHLKERFKHLKVTQQLCTFAILYSYSDLVAQEMDDSLKFALIRKFSRLLLNHPPSLLSSTHQFASDPFWNRTKTDNSEDEFIIFCNILKLPKKTWNI